MSQNRLKLAGDEDKLPYNRHNLISKLIIVEFQITDKLSFTKGTYKSSNITTKIGQYRYDNKYQFQFIAQFVSNLAVDNI